MTFKDDDFEFKPLTEGLGFHKKVIDLRESHEKIQGEGVLTMQQPVPSFNPSLKNKTIVETKKPSTMPAPKMTSNLGQPQIYNKTQIQQPVVAKKAPTAVAYAIRDDLISSATSWPAAIFDSTMVLGLVLVFSAAIFAITRIDLTELIEMLKSESAAQISAVILLVSVYGMYTVTCRTFFGKTLGDSVFFYQLGSSQDQESVFYPVKVFWRAMLMAFTGFLLLPILSTILNKDVAGILSGVSLYAEKK